MILQSNGSPEQTYARQKLAEAITAKGVPTDPKAPFNVMAENVSAIPQEFYNLEGSELYENQMFGAPTNMETPYSQPGSPLWNLYKIMADLKTDGRFVEYGGFLLAEYYKGYDTIELMNVGAGGCYLTSDGDLYFTDKTGDNAHVWHDAEDGKMNRWVAYIFAAPSTNYTIPSTELCPRSIHIGREVGTIYSPYAGRISEIVVTDGNHLRGVDFDSTQNWGSNIIIKNMLSTGTIINGSIGSTYIDIYTENANKNIMNIKGSSNLRAITIRGLKESNTNVISSDSVYNTKCLGELSKISAPDLEVLKSLNSTKISFLYLLPRDADSFSNITELHFPKLREMRYASLLYCYYTSWKCKIKQIYLPSLEVLYYSPIIDSPGNQYDIHDILEEIVLPELISVDGGINNTFIYNSHDIPTLKRIYTPKVKRFTAPLTRSNIKLSSLIDIEVGALETPFNTGSWNPTTVLSTPEGIAAINANIRDHIAAKVSDRTGDTALTFTVSANLYANLEQATIDAFTAKNWNVAGA